MAPDERFEKHCRLYARGILTGPELVNSTYDYLAHEQRFDLVPPFTLSLLGRDKVAVLNWVEWIEAECNDGSQWVPFRIGPSQRSEDSLKQIRLDFREVARIVRSLLAEHMPDNQPPASE